VSGEDRHRRTQIADAGHGGEAFRQIFLFTRPGQFALLHGMRQPPPARPAYTTALQFEQIMFRILEITSNTHSYAADQLIEYTRQMLRSLRRSNNAIGTIKGNEESIQAAVWMVELLIVLEDLKENHQARPLVNAAGELLERIEEALRAEGSLPPARD
jgi:hypothetical protein